MVLLNRFQLRPIGTANISFKKHYVPGFKNSSVGYGRDHIHRLLQIVFLLA